MTRQLRSSNPQWQAPMRLCACQFFGGHNPATAPERCKRRIARSLRCWLALSILTIACLPSQVLLAATVPTPSTLNPADYVPTTASHALIDLPSTADQADMIVGHAAPRSVLVVGSHTLRVGKDGVIVFGIARDATGSLPVLVQASDGSKYRVDITIKPREWKIERVNGVPPKTVNPPPEIAARIAREQAAVAAVRDADAAREDFLVNFIAPVAGRQSGWFGSQRVYNGTPGSAHSGMDIAAPKGTPVKAPAAGVVTFAAPDLYLTGGTVVIDHGYGISSNFLHLSRIDVKVGDRVEQGQVFAAVGSTGRATGPHMHWGMNWFEVRLDPQRVLERTARH